MSHPAHPGDQVVTFEEMLKDDGTLFAKEHGNGDEDYIESNRRHSSDQSHLELLDKPMIGKRPQRILLIHLGIWALLTAYFIPMVIFGKGKVIDS